MTSSAGRMVSASDIESLSEMLTEIAPGTITRNVDLRTLTRWRIGGPAAILAEPTSEDQLSQMLEVISKTRVPLCVLGGGSNVLFDSRGFNGIILLIGERLSAVHVDDTRISAEAGVSVPDLARLTGRLALTGIEHTVGIPGTLGGLVLMNGGSLRRGIGEHVESVRCVTLDGTPLLLSHEECQFAYRSSRLQELDAIVVSIDLKLQPGDFSTINAEMDAIVASRAARFPQDLPSCGSTFLSDPKMYAEVGAPGHAIEESGLKGLRHGDAQISPQHANFFVNLGDATSDDVLWLIAVARNTVRERTGYSMDCEVRFIGTDGVVRPTHEVALERWGHDLVA